MIVRYGQGPVEFRVRESVGRSATITIVPSFGLRDLRNSASSVIPGARDQVMRNKERSNRPIEVVGVEGRRIDVAATNLDERLVAACGVEQPAPFRDRNHRVFGTVQKQDRGVHAIDPAD